MSERQASREATERTVDAVADVPEDEHTGPVVHDKRRVDPETGQVRPGQSSRPAAPFEGSPGASAPGGAGGDVEQLTRQVAERTADLQRLQAEYANYRRRVERDRDLIRETAVANVLTNLLPVLDDIGRAREHDELTGGFKAVAEELERVTAKYGLESYGTKGDAFDPHIHEALLHSHLDGIEGPTCVEILQPGYRIKDKVIRPARVAVAEPDPNAPVVGEPEGAPEAEADDVASGD